MCAHVSLICEAYSIFFFTSKVFLEKRTIFLCYSFSFHNPVLYTVRRPSSQASSPLLIGKRLPAPRPLPCSSEAAAPPSGRSHDVVFWRVKGPDPRTLPPRAPGPLGAEAACFY